MRAAPAQLFHLLFNFAPAVTGTILFVLVIADATGERHNSFVSHKKINGLNIRRVFEFVDSCTYRDRRLFFTLYIF